MGKLGAATAQSDCKSGGAYVAVAEVSVTKGSLVVQALVSAKKKYPLPELVARQGI
jgi:hypothetical protein